MFFTEVQNKLLYATTNNTAAELLCQRINADQENAGLSNWKGNIVRKQDIYIAKNYLNTDEIDTLNRLVVIFLETAELRAKKRIDTTIDFWRENIDNIIKNNDFTLLQDKGSVSKKQMESLALGEYHKFDTRRNAFDAQQADKIDEQELKELEQKIKNRGEG